MRQVLLSGVAILALTGTAYAQVQVNDAAALIQWGTSIADDAKAYALQAKTYIGDELSWTMQAEQYATQGKQYLAEATQLAGFIHAPSLGAAMGLLNTAGLGNSLPVSPYAVMGVINGVSYGGGGLPEIEGVLSSLSSFSAGSYSANHVYSPTDGTRTSQLIVSAGNSIAGTQGTALASYADLRTHAATLQSLRDRLATSTNPKDTADITAQINLENLWTTNQQAQLAAVQTGYETQVDSRSQQVSEEITQSFDGQITQARAAGIIP